MLHRGISAQKAGDLLRRLAKGVGQTPFILASGQTTPAAMAVDLKNVYWVNEGLGTILKVAK